ncbi:MAG: pyridoxamine 5'-phosphate oxidase [Gemmatimonadota bacterium]
MTADHRPDLRSLPRADYIHSTFGVSDAGTDPIDLFRRWFSEAVGAGLFEPNAMTLATVGSDGAPGARIVLLKEVSDLGFTFFTDYRSRKARDLDSNPRAALVFLWRELGRQVRIDGTATRSPAAESDAYFASRPGGSQLGAWASHQSAVIGGRKVLEENLAEVSRRFGEGPVPRPEHWGGYRVTPALIEFWQGRPDRLHDRVCFRWSRDGWVVERLSP